MKDFTLRALMLAVFGITFASAMMIPESTAPLMTACSEFVRLLLKLCGIAEFAATIGGVMLAYFGIAWGAAMALNATLNSIPRPVLAPARA